MRDPGFGKLRSLLAEAEAGEVKEGPAADVIDNFDVVFVAERD